MTSCPHCKSKEFRGDGLTKQGYFAYFCFGCSRKFNERTGTPFNHLEYPTDVVLMLVRWYMTYKVSLRDLRDMFLERNIELTHESIRGWVKRFGPMILKELRKKRRGRSGMSWYVDETEMKVKGKTCYLYRSIDRRGNLIDCMLSEKRDMVATKKFFRSAITVVGMKPERVSTDGMTSYPRAIKETMGAKVVHRVNGYIHNYTEQSHRSVKQRYYATKGFGDFKCGSIVTRGHDELRNYLRDPRSKASSKQRRMIRKTKIFYLQRLPIVFHNSS